MNEKYTKAKFWKCALQVNSFDYNIKYRSKDHGLSEEEYNKQLLQIALENDIKVIGLANHGNVDGVEAIQKLMGEKDIIVFPGFEISTTEKIHFVCLFPEDTTKDQLNRYLGKLELTNPINDTWPSKLGGEQLLRIVAELGGFVYAAHCTQDKGILKQKLHHVWQNPLLLAAQIPSTLDELNNENNNGYYRILLNKEPEYKREISIAIINAKDVVEPADLTNPQASCLIKMTAPTFESFKLAFQDPKSRIRLNSEVPEKYYSRIESMKITGGYLDGLKIEFSEHLNAVIGGRGAGKSTLLECIRYALEQRPIGVEAQKQHDAIINENLGKSKGRVELFIRSSRMNGKLYTIARRHGESATIKDENNEMSSFTPRDLLPDIEIFGQNEIYEIARSLDGQRKILKRFMDIAGDEVENRIHETIKKLIESRKKITDTLSQAAMIEDAVAKLPKLEERLKQFKTIEEKLNILPLLETEKRLKTRILEEEILQVSQAFDIVYENLPDTVFLSDLAIDKLPHKEILLKLRVYLDQLKTDAEELLQQWNKKYNVTKSAIATLISELDTGIQKEEINLEKKFNELPSLEGKKGMEIGIEYQNLLKEIEIIRPQRTAIENKMNIVEEYRKERKLYLGELSALRSERSAMFDRAMKKLNKRLDGKMKLSIVPESDRTKIVQFLLNCNLDSVGEKRLGWINEAEVFSTLRLAELIRKGAEALKNEKGWSITATVADTLARLNEDKILQLEELELPDSINIELNVAHEGKEEYKKMANLSTGQQCTAILHLLLLKNTDPLIMDQPEDNLDNAFIAERIVTELRNAKIDRQFLFATHNANIPVFGDAEWIGVLDTKEGIGEIPSELQGSIDVPLVRSRAADILEGGREAFNQRKLKYNF